MFASTVLSRLTKSTSQPLLPISASASASTAPPYTDTVRPSSSDASATLLALARQEAHLQSHIQYLLDVQSDRLIEGLGEPQQPPPKHQQDTSQPPNNASSLQTTRHDLSDAISALASLKASSASILSASLAAATASLSAITSIQRRKSALTAKIAELLEHYSSSPPPASSASLSLDDDGDDFLGRREEEEEEEALGREIEEAENRLWAMKARRRVLREKVQEARNRREARVSSWRRSLELLGEEEEEVVLKGNPAASSLFAGEGKGKGKGRESVWDLKPKRRTLEMVREWYVSEREGLAGRLEDVGKEREALEEGGRVWAEVVRVVGGVEALLEKEMNGLDSCSSSGEGGGEHRREEGMERVLKAMKDARESVEEKLQLAREKGWKLLVVAVGAELEALVEGEE
ncbi:MAG: hypothetical protein Q9177_005301 [Variospora cf. flavescens]